MQHRDSDGPPATPTRCPSCGSREMTTTSKTVGPTTYWRCLSCGEVWNLDRRTPDRRTGFGR